MKHFPIPRTRLSSSGWYRDMYVCEQGAVRHFCVGNGDRCSEKMAGCATPCEHLPDIIIQEHQPAAACSLIVRAQFSAVAVSTVSLIKNYKNIFSPERAFV